MSDERRKVPLDEALRRIGDGDVVHTFIGSDMMLVGADRSRADIEALLREHGAEESGATATHMGHSLACFCDGRWLFIEAGVDPTPSEAA